MLETSGSAAYHLAADERAVVHTASGRRYPLRGRPLDLYRVLSYARGHCLTEVDLVEIIWRGYATRNNVTVHLQFLRRLIARDVIENVKGHGYIVR
jgi:DNA-binding response OmpR family regulator